MKKRLINKSKQLTIASVAIATLGVGYVASEPIHVFANTIHESVLRASHGSSFTEKEVFIAESQVLSESKDALDKVTAKWIERDIDSIKDEVERQKEAGLEVYIVQWGDTLSNIAAATNQTTDHLAEINNISDSNLILTGDIFIGVLDEVEVSDTTTNGNVSGGSQNTASTKPVTPNKPEDSVKPDESTKPEESEKPDESTKPEESEKPDESTPTEPETPEELPSRYFPGSVGKVTSDNPRIDGIASTNSTVVATLPDGSKHEIKVDNNGAWIFELPEGVKLADGEKILFVFQTKMA